MQFIIKKSRHCAVMIKSLGRVSVDLHAKEPSEAQKRAGNYRKEKGLFAGLPITIENKAGTYRRGVDPDGKAWATLMHCPYGYIRGSEGLDGDHLDCFLGPDEDAPDVYVVMTMKAPAFKVKDEQKAMLGFRDAHAAKAAFMDHYNGPRHFGSMISLPVETFRDFVKNPDNRGKAVRGKPTGLRAVNVNLSGIAG